MSLDELISIERVEFEFERSRIQETYLVDNLLLSRLFEELITELKNDILPILDMYILLRALQSVPFTDEAKGIETIEILSRWMNGELYGKGVKCSEIVKILGELNELILYDYAIEGSLTVYRDYHINWDLEVSLLKLPQFINLSES
ncbi:hypothetical protein ES705_13803 [subsurface metagenome]